MSLGSLLPTLSPGTIFALIIATLGAYLIWRSFQSRGMPPGPPSFPLVGSLLSLRGDDIREELCRLARRYGDVFTMDMGMNRTVMLASYDAIKEALVKNAQALSGRPQDLLLMQEISQGQGVGASEGPLWREHRKFLHGVFRDFGVGRPVFEEKIQEEISFLLQVFRDNIKRTLDPASIIQKAVSNVVNNVTFGQRYEYVDPMFLRHIDILEKNFRVLGNSGALAMFPFLKYLPGDFFEYKRMRRDTESAFEDYTGIIDQHRASRTPGVIRDFIDAYLEEAERQKNQKDTTFTDAQLRMVISDLFAAATETTATTLRWALLFLLHNPDIMQRAQRVIEEVLGPSRMPSMKDKLHMPYIEAVLAEIQRMGDIAPLGIPHANTEDVFLRGYRIPKRTHFFPLLYAAHRDPNIWQEPDRFNPERFLDGDGKFVKNEHLIPFSMGRRVCLGESLARMELFLFLVALLQHFNFRSPPGVRLPSLKGNMAVTYSPQPFQVLIELKS